MFSASCLWLCSGQPPYVLNFDGRKLSRNQLFLPYVVNTGCFCHTLQKSRWGSLKHDFSLSSLERHGHACCGTLEKKKTKITSKTNLALKCGRWDLNQRTSSKKGELNSRWHHTQPNFLLPLPEIVISASAPKIRWKPELFLHIKITTRTDFISSNLQRIEEQGIKISARQVLLAPPMPLCLPSPSLCSDTDQWLLKASWPEMASRLRQWGTQEDGRKEDDIL